MTLILVAKFLGMVLYSALEYWLGKTDKVKANSILDLVIQAATKLKSSLIPAK